MDKFKRFGTLRYLTLLGLITMSLSALQAQWFRLGMSGDYNIGRVFFNPDRAKEKRALYSGGFLLQYRHDTWNILVETGMSYKMKGWISPQKSLLDLTPNTPVTLKYIEIPLRTYMFFGRTKYIDYFINTGNFIGFRFNHDARIDSVTQRLSYGWEGYIGFVLKTKFGNLQLKAGGIFHFSNFLKKEHKDISSLSRYSASSFQIVYFSPIVFNFNNHKRSKRLVAKNRPRFSPDFPIYSEKEKQHIRERKRQKTVSSLTTYEHPKKEKETVGFGGFGAGKSKGKERKSSGFGGFGAGKSKGKERKSSGFGGFGAGKSKGKERKSSGFGGFGAGKSKGKERKGSGFGGFGAGKSKGKERKGSGFGGFGAGKNRKGSKTKHQRRAQKKRSKHRAPNYIKYGGRRK